MDVLTMRVVISFEGSCEPFDVPPDQTVGAMKQMVKEHFLVHFSDDKQIRQYLELSYGGAALQDIWVLCDVGIRSGCVIQCLIKSEQRPLMRVFNAVTGKPFLIMGSNVLQMSVAGLKSVVSKQSALPVSTFRLSTPAGVQLYDCNQLQDYSIEVGTTLRLDTWDGWVEFLQGCLNGHRPTVQSHLSEKKPVMRFQMQVALYIASSLGHLDLAGWLLERGVRAEEPVGVHPYRMWCNQTSHRDTGKCPIHIAAESSQLLILKLFINKNPLNLACRDPEGHDPLKVALQRGDRDCVRFLTNKVYSVVSVSNISLPMRVYLQVKRWMSLGQNRAASNQCQYPSAAFKARVEDKELVDGFSRPNMSSKSRKSMTKLSRGSKVKALQPFAAPNSNLLSISDLIFRRAALLGLQPDVNPGDSIEMQNMWKQDLNRRKDGQLEEDSEEDSSFKKGKLALPPINRKNITRPMFVDAAPKSSRIPTVSLESLSHQCCRTPRENAIYYLTTASTFTEVPWLKQLKIARILIRKRAHTMD